MVLNEEKIKKELQEIKELLEMARDNTYNFENLARERISEANGKISTLINIIEWQK